MDSTVAMFVQAHHTILLDNFFGQCVYLGSYVNLALIFVFCLCYLWVCKEYQQMALIIGSLFSAMIILEIIRFIINSSKGVDQYFSLLTMTVYLLVANAIVDKHKDLIIAYALFISILVGVAKIYFGINLCSDVLISWVLAGLISYTYYYMKKAFITK